MKLQGELMEFMKDCYKYSNLQLQLTTKGEKALYFFKTILLIMVTIFIGFSSIEARVFTIQTGKEDGLKLNFTDEGAISEVITPKGNLASSAPSGFFVRDVVTEKDIELKRIVQGQDNGVLLYKAYEPDPKDSFKSLNINLEATFTSHPNRIETDIYIKNLNTNDQALIIYFVLPINMHGWKWGDDIRRSHFVAGTTEIQNTVDIGFGYHNQTSRYPIAAVYGSDGIAIGFPLDHPAAIRLIANPATNQLYIAFDVALSPHSKIPNAAYLRAIVYRFDPEWGFRSAIKKYYDIYPEFFKKRVNKEGLWAGIFGDLNHITNINDFGIAYHTTGVRQKALSFNDINNIYSLRYLLLAGERTFCNTLSNNLITSLSSRDDSYAKSILNSGIYNKDNTYVIYSSDNDACYYDRNKPNYIGHATIVVNTNPAIKEPNIATYLWDNSTRSIYSSPPDGGVLDGEFIDGVEGQSIRYADQLDYRKEHISASTFPLTYRYEYSSQIGKDILIPYPGTPVLTGTYEFLKWLRKDILDMNKLMMGNYSLKRYLPIAHLMDIMGSEISMGTKAQVNMKGNFSLEPQFDRLFDLWRTISYQKPYNLLLHFAYGNDWTHVTSDVIEHYFKNALFYGFYPGLIGIGDNPNLLYFKNPDIYERDRSLFKKYIPLIQALGSAGWEPVTYAKSDNPSIYVERYGPKSLGSIWYITVRNISDKRQTYSLTLTVETLGLTNALAVDFIDLITGDVVTATKTKLDETYLTIKDTIEANEVRMFTIKKGVYTDNSNSG